MELQSIGKLERHIHTMFQDARIPGASSIYCTDVKRYDPLEVYCDAEEDLSPIILFGEKGTGKSSFLANWIKKRERDNQRARGNINNEFIFYHAVGCSRQSMNVNSMLRRLMNGLKDFFELSRDVPLDEDRLSWDLPLFLEQGAKKGRITLVIDGLHRLMENSVDGLTWLPLSFHPNVKLVMAAGLPDAYFRDGDSTDDLDMRKPRIFIEMERRNWQQLRMSTVTVDLSREIIISFIQQSVQSDAAVMNTSSFITEFNFSSRKMPGLLLFETMIESILSHSTASSKPIFLSLILRMARWLSSRGWSMWHLIDEWLKSEDTDGLLNTMLDRVETGYTKTREHMQSARDRCVQAGGYNSLKALYPWHPSFKEEEDREGLSTEIEVLMQAGGNIHNSSSNAVNGQGNDSPGKSTLTSKKQGAKGGDVMTALEDQRWYRTNESAKERLSYTQMYIKKLLADKVERMKLANSPIRSESNQSLTGMAYDHELPVDYTGRINIELLMKEMKEMENEGNHNDDKCSDIHVEEEWADVTTSRVEEDDDETEFLEVGEAADQIGDTQTEQQTKQQRKNNAVASKGLETLPVYLLGGSSQEGFGQLVGDALSLLYVARHGLTEDELWSILATLNTEKAHALQERTIGDDARALIRVCYGYRGILEDYFRSSDRKLRGRLTRMQIMAVFRQVNPQFDSTDLDLLFSIVDFWDQEVKQEGGFEYMDLIKRIERTERSMKAEDLNSNRPVEDVAETGSLQSDMDTMTGERREMIDSKTAQVHTIGPLMEEALLSFLVAFGVLHSPQNRTLVLPFDFEDLRNVIFSRYISPKIPTDDDDDDEDLEKEVQLNNTQSTVLTLGMNKDGIDFWHSKLITHFQKQPINLRRCEELLWHLKICRRWHVLKDCMADLHTFDLMFYDDGELREEYMHYWKELSEGPLYNSQRGERDALMDKGDDSESHRILVELDNAARLGMTEAEMRKALLKSKTSPFDLVEEFHQSLTKWTVKTKAGIHATAMRVNQISEFMAEFAKKSDVPPNFIRLALPKPILADSYGVKFGALEITDMTDETEIKTIEELEAHQRAQAELKATHEARLYCYRRWMWAQWPILALAYVTDKARNEDSQITEKESKDTEDILIEEGLIERKNEENVNTVIADQTFMNNFKIKKADPTAPPIFGVSQSRQTAMIANSVTPAKEILALNNITKFFAEKAQNEAKKPGGKFKRTIAEDRELFKSIPHASASVRSTNRNTKFPTIDQMLKERGNKSEGSMLMTPQEIALLGKDPAEFGGGAVATINRLQEDEDLEYQNSRRTVAMPGSMTEISYGRELERMGRLRTISDQTVQKRRQKLAELEELRRRFMSRQEDDEYVLAGLVSGESAILHMEDRLVALRTALSEAQRTAVQYKGLIEFLDKNPPQKPDHLKALEQSVDLSRQQLNDLMKFRKQLYVEFDLKGLTRRKNLTNKLKQYKKLRKGLNKKADNAYKKTERVNNEIKEIEEQAKKDTMALYGLVDTGPGSVYSIASESTVAEAEGDIARRMENVRLAVDAFTSAGHKLSDEEIHAHSTVVQAEMSWEYLMAQTGCTGEENFLDTWHESVNLTEKLKAQQSMTESRVSQLRHEHQELNLLAMDYPDESNVTNGGSIENAARAYDQGTMAAEIRLGQSGRLAEHATLMINEIRSGVEHVINMLQANNKLLHNLPSSNPPPLLVDDDIVRALSWSEERVLAINEALVLDSGTKNTGEDSKVPVKISDRQIDMAKKVEMLMIRSPGGRQKHKPKKRPHKKGHTNISHTIIDFSEDSGFVSPRGIMVPFEEEKPLVYDHFVDEARSRVDSHQEKLEIQSKVKVADKTVGVAKFLQDALATHESQEKLRRANHLANKKQGRNAGFGLALEDLLKSKGPELLEGKDQKNQFANTKITFTKLDFDVPSRDEVKVQAEKRKRKALREMSSEAKEGEGEEGAEEGSPVKQQHK